MTLPRVEPQPEPGRVFTPLGLTVITVLLAWIAFLEAWDHRWQAALVGGVARLLALLLRTRGRILSQRRNRALRDALAAAAARNDELEALRHLAQVLLTGHSLPHLLKEVAHFSAELLQGEAAGIGLVVEEGRFIRVAAGTGMMEHALDRLVPLDGSIAG